MGPTILIVDDEEMLREAIAFDFKRKKFNVLTAKSGNEAFKIVEREKIDLVLSDVCMADGDGVALLDRIKERDAFLPVVMLITGFADITLEEAYDKGADAVFSKPFDRKVLMTAVERAIQPADKRFIRKVSRVDVDIPIGITFLKSGFSLEAKIRNLGRGGMFVAMEGQFPTGLEEAEFRIETQTDPAFTITGDGIVRWVRKSATEPLASGCGVEFVGLSQDSVKNLLDLVNFVKTKTYIPRK